MFKVIKHGWAVEVALAWDMTKSETVTVSEHLSYEDATSLAIGRIWQRYGTAILSAWANDQAAYGGRYAYHINYDGVKCQSVVG